MEDCNAAGTRLQGENRDGESGIPLADLHLLSRMVKEVAQRIPQKRPGQVKAHWVVYFTYPEPQP
jgi:hypothetical protein